MELMDSKSKLLNDLNPNRAVYAVLGNLCKNTKALRDPEIKNFLDKDKFLLPFHQTIFIAIHNIAKSGGVNSITHVDIDNYLAPHTKLWKIWEKHNGVQVMEDAIEIANIDTFKYNFDLLVKYAYLRDCVVNGIDISEIFDNTDDLKEANGKKNIEKMKLDEMKEIINSKLVHFKNKWNIGTHSKGFMAGDDLDTLIEELNADPEYGYPFQNGYYNSLFRGMRPRKFMLRSATTGGGKTRQAISDMCLTACPEIYSYEKKAWIKNGKVHPALFISTELEKREVQTIMLAFITGINEDMLKDGNFAELEDDTKQRIYHGIDVLKLTPLHCECIEDFTISDIEGIIEQHCIDFGIKFVAFDYIQMTPKLSRSMQNAFGLTLREDQILVQFSAALKSLANNYDLFIESSTQLNRQHKDDNQKDTNSLRGGSATADKVDHGILSFRATAADKEKVKELISRYGEPNFYHKVYKNRSGRTDVIIWTNMDLGTMREIPLFLTDADYNLITNIMQKQLYAGDDEDFFNTEDEGLEF